MIVKFRLSFQGTTQIPKSKNLVRKPHSLTTDQCQGKPNQKKNRDKDISKRKDQERKSNDRMQDSQGLSRGYFFFDTLRQDIRQDSHEIIHTAFDTFV